MDLVIFLGSFVTYRDDFLTMIFVSGPGGIIILNFIPPLFPTRFHPSCKKFYIGAGTARLDDLIQFVWLS